MRKLMFNFKTAAIASITEVLKELERILNQLSFNYCFVEQDWNMLTGKFYEQGSPKRGRASLFT